MALAQLSIDLTAKIASFEAELKRSTRVAEEQAGKMQAALGLVSQAMGALGAGLSVTAFASFIRTNADLADEMSKVARRAGVSTEAMSALAYAASLADVDNQELARGLRTLGNDAAAGGKKLRELGVDLVDSAGKTRTSDELFREVATRIAGIEDPARRAAAASELFGDKLGAQLIPLLEGGRTALEDAGKEAERFNKIISTESGAAAEVFNDNISRMQARLEGFAKTLANPVISGLNGLFAGFERSLQRNSVGLLAMDVNRLNADLKALEGRRGNPFINQEKLEENIRQTKEKLEQAKDAFRKADQELLNPPAPVAPPPFTPSAGALGVTDTSTRSAAAKISEGERYLQNLQRQLEATKDLTVEEALLRDISLGRLGTVSNTQRQALVDVARQIDAARTAQQVEKERWEIITARRQAVIDEAAAVDEANAKWESLLQSLVADTAVEKTNRLIESVKVLDEALILGKISAEQHAEALKKITETSKEVDKGGKELAMTFTSAFEDAVLGGQKLSQVLQGLLQDILRIVMRKMITEPLGNALAGSLNGVIPFGGGRASGGPVSAGRAYLVGEAGPELLYMGASGSVVPNSRLGGETSVVVNNYGNDKASARETQDSRGNRRIEVTIGELVAAEIRRNGSAPNNAMRQSFGARPALVGR